MNISQSAVDLIVQEEVSSKAYYEKHYTHPEWPGGASGVTVGIGYDLGYATRTKISQDFRGKVSDAMLAVMQSCAGITGSSAAALLPKVRPHIVIPWNLAMDVFMNRDIPQWTTLVSKTLPNCGLLNPTCFGVLVSLAYNRGTGGFNSSTDRNREMVAIKRHMISKQFSHIPAELRSMARIWPKMKGLQARRKREADLFARGLAAGSSSTAKPVPIPPVPIDPGVSTGNRPDEPARTPQPPTTIEQNAGVGAVVVGGVVAAFTWGGDLSTTLAIIAAAAAIGGAIWYAIYRHRNPS